MNIRSKPFYLILFLSFILSFGLEDMIDKKGLMNNNNTQDFNNSLLGNADTEFMSIYESPINPNEYKVGVGDSFLFTMIYPAGAMNTQLIVSPVGDVLIPLIGNIEVNDMILTDALEKIKSRCLNKYENADVNITLFKIRHFKLKVVGAVKSPGYKIASPIHRVSDVLYEIMLEPMIGIQDSLKKHKTIKHKNILFKPLQKDSTQRYNYSQFSSKRNIQLIRGDEKINVDLSKFNLIGDDKLNPRLQMGDIIKVPYKQDMVGVYGAVHQQNQYEYVVGESLYELITIAGGFSAYSDSNNIVVTRLSDDLNTEIFHLKTINETKNFIIQPNDHVNVRYKEHFNKQNIVEIFGEVVSPAIYSINLGVTTIRDIIEMSGGYSKIADKKQIIINNKDIQIKDDKELSRIRNTSPINLSLIDKAYLKARSGISKGKISSSNTEFTNNILDFKLISGDQIYIPKKLDYIEVIGAISNPGRYPLRDQFNGKDYINLSGGETVNSTGKLFIIKHGSSQRIKLTKSTVIESGDIIFVAEKIEQDILKRTKDIVSIIYQVLIALLTVNTLLNS